MELTSELTSVRATIESEIRKLDEKINEAQDAKAKLNDALNALSGKGKSEPVKSAGQPVAAVKNNAGATKTVVKKTAKKAKPAIKKAAPKPVASEKIVTRDKIEKPMNVAQSAADKPQKTAKTSANKTAAAGKNKGANQSPVATKKTASKATSAKPVKIEKPKAVKKQKLPKTAAEALAMAGVQAKTAAASKKPVAGNAKTAQRSTALPVRTEANAAPASTNAAGNGEKINKLTPQFWQKLISRNPKSVREVVMEANRELKITPTKEDTQALMEHATSALEKLANSGAIKNQGTGGARVFFV